MLKRLLVIAGLTLLAAMAGVSLAFTPAAKLDRATLGSSTNASLRAVIEQLVLEAWDRDARFCFTC